MTAVRSWRPIWRTDVMNATFGRHSLRALITCCLINTSAYAADTGASGGGTGLASDQVPRNELAPAAENVKREAPRQEAPTKRNDITGQSSNVKTSAARSKGPTAAHAGGTLVAHRGAEPPLSAHAYGSRPAARSDPVTEAARQIGATSASVVAGRQLPAVSAAVSRPVVSLKSTAGNGVLGGPRTEGRGTLGGPANSRLVTRTSIDGTTLRRRF
jgi:hypothetical protein